MQELKEKLQLIVVDAPINETTHWDDYDSQFQIVAQPANKFVASQREMDKYLGEEFLGRKENPLKWWNEPRQAQIY